MDTMSPGRAIGREIATGDRADSQLDSFISRRQDQRVKSEPEREAEAAWAEAERREAARRRSENLASWYGWHLDRVDLCGRLSREHAEGRKTDGSSREENGMNKQQIREGHEARGQARRRRPRPAGLRRRLRVPRRDR